MTAPPLPGAARRWVVERTLSWVTQHRRTVRDYETPARQHETYVCWAMIIVMTRRLARQPRAAQPAIALVLNQALTGTDRGVVPGCPVRLMRLT
jgi:hypothetical protein